MSRRWVDEFYFDQKDKLGAGQFGTVYRGTDSKTNETVAIKVIAKDTLDDYLYQQLGNEVNALSSVHSPSIVKFITFRVTENNVYIVTEYCDGGDMDGIIKKRGKLPEKEVLGYLRELCEALSEFKRHNVMHRDLKPANILINHGKIKIADLGLAKIAMNFEKAMKHSVVGSPLYMSPQLLQRDPYSYKCDIWSIGIIIYQLLYGTAPWVAPDIGMLTMKIFSKPLQFPREPAVSPEMIEAIKRCLQFEERDRISLEDFMRLPLFAGPPKKLFEVPPYSAPQIQMLPMLPLDYPAKPAPYPIARPYSDQGPGGYTPGHMGSPAIHGEVTPNNRTPVGYQPQRDNRRPSASPGGRATPTPRGGRPNTMHGGAPDISPMGGGGYLAPGQRAKTPVYGGGGANAGGVGGWPQYNLPSPMRPPNH